MNRVLNQPVDVSEEYARLENHIFVATETVAFDPVSGKGTLRWKRSSRKTRMAFAQIVKPIEETPSWEFPPDYEQDPVLPFEISFVTPRTVRVRLHARAHAETDAASLMLTGTPATSDAWQLRQEAGRVIWQGPHGTLTLTEKPWRIEFRNAAGRLMTGTRQTEDTKCLLNSISAPFSFIRRARDVGCQFAASFSLAPGEKIFGCGESFTRLDKRGQKVVLCTTDAHGVQNADMYKPIPFFLSNRGYGLFVHSSAPMTFDLGKSYDSTSTLHVGDDELDFFLFYGSPQEILSEYTALTGRSPLPPLWSFGLWMSRITYRSEAETREVAGLLREHRIPCDVIHLDTGWFETDWRCDYAFSKSRYGDPGKMIKDLRAQGFRISLWQLPYFLPTNPLYREAIEQGYIVRDAKGHSASEDAILDFSNPEAVRWYQDLLSSLLKNGVSAIKVDFGEAAPLEGLYASGRTGWYEHNLYPLRYNRAVAEITRGITGENIIWARSAWAGSQRYPLHWGGDAENTDSAMAASLRGGLSLGLCGFSFWSHDIGGFVKESPEALYRRWLPFGMLTSHTRCHGLPPKEPWAYGEDFTAAFRRSVELKYRLMPYVYTQAKLSSDHGWPMLRPLFFEFPDDPGAWLVEDQYFFGRELLVAPLMEETTDRQVYLPPGDWKDYQTGQSYAGGRWHMIAAGELPIIIMVRSGAVIPHLAVAQSTDRMEWNQIELHVFADNEQTVEGDLFVPGAEQVARLRVIRGSEKVEASCDEFTRGVKWTILEK